MATMGSNKPTLYLEMNMLINLWCTIIANQVLCHTFPKYIKLTKIAIVHVFNSMEDECCFSSLSFLKSKLRNALDPHLQFVMGMYS
jgi:hypothetical protein